MHVFTHTFDYIVLGILLACMLGAAAMVILRRAAPRHGGGKRRVGMS